MVVVRQGGVEGSSVQQSSIPQGQLGGLHPHVHLHLIHLIEFHGHEIPRVWHAFGIDICSLFMRF